MNLLFDYLFHLHPRVLPFMKAILLPEPDLVLVSLFFPAFCILGLEQVEGYKTPARNKSQSGKLLSSFAIYQDT